MRVSTVSLYEDRYRGRAAVIWHNNTMYAIINDRCFICECLLGEDSYKMLDLRTGDATAWKSMVASRLCSTDVDYDVLTKHEFVKRKMTELCIANFVDGWVDVLYEKMHAHLLPTKVIVKIDYESCAIVYGGQELFIYDNYVYTANKEIVYRGTSYKKLLAEFATELFFDSFSYNKSSKEENKIMKNEIKKYQKERCL